MATLPTLEGRGVPRNEHESHSLSTRSSIETLFSGFLSLSMILQYRSFAALFALTISVLSHVKLLFRHTMSSLLVRRS